MTDTRDVMYDSTAPVFRVGGAERAELARDTLAVEVEEDEAGLKRLACTLAAVGPGGGRDEQLLYMDAATLDFGTQLQVDMGPRSAARQVFDGKVSALELAMHQGRDPEVRVLAEDRLMDLRMKRRFKTYENVSDADLVQQIAGEHGLTAQSQVDGPTYKTVQQWNQSDLAFLRERAARVGAEVWVEGATLHVASRANRRSAAPCVTLVQGNDLLAVEVRADLAHQRSTQNVSGYDEVAKAQIDEQSGSGDASGEAGGGRGGIAVLTQAFGDRATFRVRDVPFATADATAWAKAALLRRARRFLTVRGITLGTPTLAVGATLTLERVGPLFEGGEYYVTRVAHRFDTHEGYRTHFEAERAWIGNPA